MHTWGTPGAQSRAHLGHISGTPRAQSTPGAHLGHNHLGHTSGTSRAHLGHNHLGHTWGTPRAHLGHKHLRHGHSGNMNYNWATIIMILLVWHTLRKLRIILCEGRDPDVVSNPNYRVTGKSLALFKFSKSQNINNLLKCQSNSNNYLTHVLSHTFSLNK